MSYYRVIDTIDSGHHAITVENEDGIEFARGDGRSLFHALANLQQAMRPTNRNPNDWWVQPLDETEDDYDRY